MIKKKIWYLILSTGPFFLFFVSGLIGKIVGFPWMYGLVNNGSLIFPIGLILMIYALINFEITLRNAKKDELSAINTIPYPKIWTPILIWMQICTGVILYITDIRITFIEMVPEALRWYPSGWITLGYLVGFTSPLPSLLVFSPTKLKNFLSSKRHYITL